MSQEWINARRSAPGAPTLTPIIRGHGILGGRSNNGVGSRGLDNSRAENGGSGLRHNRPGGSWRTRLWNVKQPALPSKAWCKWTLDDFRV